METGEADAVPLWQRLLIGRKPKRTLLRAAVTAVTIWTAAYFILVPVRITGGSMEPSYKDKSVNLINRMAYWRSNPKRGDVVALVTDPAGRRWAHPRNFYFKRIIGLPGETVRIHIGKVFVDGQLLSEPYVRFWQPWEDAPRKLGLDEFLVIGDNRGMPQEWHWWGTVKANQIAGKAVL